MTSRPAAAPSTSPARPPRPPVPRGRGAGAAGAASWAARGLAAALVAVATLVGTVGTVGGVAPAAAHDALTGSSPADGSTVETPPASIDLTFSEPPLGIGAEIQVTGPDGAPVAAGRPAPAGTTVSLPLPAELPAGAYAVAWRVTSSDGHPLSGSLSFTATTGTAAAGGTASDATGDAGTEPAAEPTGASTVEPTAPAPEGTATAAPPQARPGADVADARAGDDGSPLPWVLGVLALLAAAGGAWVVARRRPEGPGPR